MSLPECLSAALAPVSMAPSLCPYSMYSWCPLHFFHLPTSTAYMVLYWCVSMHMLVSMCACIHMLIPLVSPMFCGLSRSTQLDTMTYNESLNDTFSQRIHWKIFPHPIVLVPHQHCFNVAFPTNNDLVNQWIPVPGCSLFILSSPVDRLLHEQWISHTISTTLSVCRSITLLLPASLICCPLSLSAGRTGEQHDILPEFDVEIMPGMAPSPSLPPSFSPSPSHAGIHWLN